MCLRRGQRQGEGICAHLTPSECLNAGARWSDILLSFCVVSFSCSCSSSPTSVSCPNCEVRPRPKKPWLLPAASSRPRSEPGSMSVLARDDNKICEPCVSNCWCLRSCPPNAGAVDLDRDVWRRGGGRGEGECAHRRVGLRARGGYHDSCKSNNGESCQPDCAHCRPVPARASRSTVFSLRGCGGKGR